MKLSIELFIGLCYVISVATAESYFYEKINRFGLGNRIIRRAWNSHYEHPETLPSPIPTSYLRSPYHSLYQGSRMTNDTRVYRRRFEYKAKSTGHHLFCEGLFDCVLSHLAIETMEGIPIILRGGVGYRFFDVVIKAKPGDHLKGSIRAYCKKKDENVYFKK